MFENFSLERLQFSGLGFKDVLFEKLKFGNIELGNLVPEILLLGIALLVLGLNLFTRISTKRLVGITFVLATALIMFIFYAYPYDMLLHHKYDMDRHAKKVKVCLLVFAMVCAIFFAILEKIRSVKFTREYLSLLLFSTFGGFIAVGAHDFLTLFMGIELQSLIAYVLSSLYTDSPTSSEAGLKYFCLGAISSCLMLFGISLLYGSNGSLTYGYINDNNETAFFGLFLIVVALLFKLGSAPVHMWLPDVYQGSPIFAVNVFVTISKLTVLVGLINIIPHQLSKLTPKLGALFSVAAVLSLVIGALGALKQINFKRFIGYSSIFNMGYILISLVTQDYKLAVVYLLAYTLSVFMIFSIVTSIGIDLDKMSIADLSGLAKSAKFESYLLGICLLSLIGIPPMLGFLAKYYVLYKTVATKHYYLAVFASAMTLISAYYYLRILKTVFLDSASSITLKPSCMTYKALNLAGVLVLVGGWSYLRATFLFSFACM